MTPRARTVLASLVVFVIAAALARADQVLTGLGGGGGGVLLQATFPGSPQTGYANITGALTAAQFQPTASGYFGCLVSQTCSVVGFKSPSTGAPFYFDAVGGLSFNATMVDFKSAGGSIMGIGYRKVRLDGGGANDTACQAGPGGCVTTGGQLNLISLGGRVVSDTAGFAIASGNLFQINNNGGNKFAVDYTGAVSTAVPIPLAAGGTGTASTTPCSAGQFVTNNGTSLVCTTPPPGTVIASGQVNADGTIAVQYGQAVTAGTRTGGSGLYVININGMTATTGVIVITPFMPSAAAGRHATVLPGLNSFQVQTKSGADGLIDERFMYVVEHL